MKNMRCRINEGITQRRMGQKQDTDHTFDYEVRLDLPAKKLAALMLRLPVQ